MTERVLRKIVLSISALAHLVAFIQFGFQVAVSASYQFQLPANYEIFSIWLLALSLILAIFMYYSQPENRYWILFGIRGLILILLGRMSGDYFGIETTLLAVLIIEACIYLPLWKGIIYSSGLTLFMVLFHALAVWLKMPFFNWHEHLGFLMNAVIIIGMTSLLRFQRENQVSVTELNRRLNEATVELVQTNMKLQEYAISAEQEAMLNERKRVAREVHDTLAYTLTNLVMMMEAAVDLISKKSPKITEHLELAREQANEGLKEVRQALHALRPVQLTDLNGLAAICRLVKAFQKASQIKVELELGDAPLNFGAEANLVVFRLVQEGLTNALRHGRATLITVSLARVRDGLSVTIKDNGVGSGDAAPNTGYGLVGMRERLEKLGGKLETSGVIGEGFTLMAWLPIWEG
jgi:signal transduction histidine kinase